VWTRSIRAIFEALSARLVAGRFFEAEDAVSGGRGAAPGLDEHDGVVHTLDAISFLAACLSLLAATLGARALPARRAVRLDPAVALRSD
jgi:ABC-type lipoprotein release transport system permease subunit